MNYFLYANLLFVLIHSRGELISSVLILIINFKKLPWTSLVHISHWRFQDGGFEFLSAAFLPKNTRRQVLIFDINLWTLLYILLWKLAIFFMFVKRRWVYTTTPRFGKPVFSLPTGVEILSPRGTFSLRLWWRYSPNKLWRHA